jgi:hypothetical protein
MRCINRSLFVFLIVIFSASVLAEDDLRYGLFPAVTSLDVNDPDGPAETASYVSVLSGIIVSDMRRDSRLLAHAYYDKEQEIEGDQINIHQDVTRSGASMSYQINSRLTRSWKPWFGLGIGYNDESIINRYTVTAGGFLNQQYDDITHSSMTALFSASSEWRLGRDWDMGLHIQIEEPFNEGVSVTRIGFYFVY